MKPEEEHIELGELLRDDEKPALAFDFNTGAPYLGFDQIYLYANGEHSSQDPRYLTEADARAVGATLRDAQSPTLDVVVFTQNRGDAVAEILELRHASAYDGLPEAELFDPTTTEHINTSDIDDWVDRRTQDPHVRELSRWMLYGAYDKNFTYGDESAYSQQLTVEELHSKTFDANDIVQSHWQEHEQSITQARRLTFGSPYDDLMQNAESPWHVRDVWNAAFLKGKAFAQKAALVTGLSVLTTLGACQAQASEDGVTPYTTTHAALDCGVSQVVSSWFGTQNRAGCDYAQNLGAGVRFDLDQIVRNGIDSAKGRIKKRRSSAQVQAQPQTQLQPQSTLQLTPLPMDQLAIKDLHADWQALVKIMETKLSNGDKLSKPSLRFLSDFYTRVTQVKGIQPVEQTLSLKRIAELNILRGGGTPDDFDTLEKIKQSGVPKNAQLNLEQFFQNHAPDVAEPVIMKSGVSLLPDSWADALNRGFDAFIDSISERPTLWDGVRKSTDSRQTNQVVREAYQNLPANDRTAQREFEQLLLGELLLATKTRWEVDQEPVNPPPDHFAHTPAFQNLMASINGELVKVDYEELLGALDKEVALRHEDLGDDNAHAHALSELVELRMYYSHPELPARPFTFTVDDLNEDATYLARAEHVDLATVQIGPFLATMQGIGAKDNFLIDRIAVRSTWDNLSIDSATITMRDGTERNFSLRPSVDGGEVELVLAPHEFHRLSEIDRLDVMTRDAHERLTPMQVIHATDDALDRHMEALTGIRDRSELGAGGYAFGDLPDDQTYIDEATAYQQFKYSQDVILQVKETDWGMDMGAGGAAITVPYELGEQLIENAGSERFQDGDTIPVCINETESSWGVRCPDNMRNHLLLVPLIDAAIPEMLDKANPPNLRIGNKQLDREVAIDTLAQSNDQRQRRRLDHSLGIE